MMKRSVRPARFYGQDRYGKPTGVTIYKNVVMDELKKVYMDVVRPIVLNAKRSTLQLLENGSA